MSPEDFDEAMSKAAHIADKATWHAMREMASRRAYDEDDTTGELIGELNAALRGQIGPMHWKAKILRHRKGVAGEELRYGADISFHMSYKDRNRRFSKGVLIQSKKVEPHVAMSAKEHTRLVGQCETMLTHSAASYVFDYAEGGLRVSSANKISGLSDRYLHSNCEWTAYRFFYEFFRCPVGDRRVTTTHIGSDLIVGSKAIEDGGLPAIVEFEAIGVD